MPGQGLDRIPLRVPEDWDPVWFATIWRDVLSLADVRNAIEGPGIAISGASDEKATVSASADLAALLEAALVVAIADPDLPNARQLVAGDGSITITDSGDELALELTRFGVTLDRLNKIPALSILGSQNLEDPGNVDVVQSAADDTLVRRVAGAIDWGVLTLPMIPDGLITFAKLQNADALSVLGRASNSAGVLDELAAGTDHHIMRRSGTAIGFGSIDLSQSAAVGSSRLAFANVAQITGQAVLGVASAGAGDLAAIAAGTNDRLLSQTSGSLAFTQLTAGMFPNAVVPDAALSANVALLDSGSETVTLTGMTASTTGTATWSITGNRVTVSVPLGLTGTSNATTMKMTGLPAGLQTNRNQWIPIVGLVDNALGCVGFAGVNQLNTDVDFFPFDPSITANRLRSGTFTASGTKGLTNSTMFTYDLE